MTSKSEGAAKVGTSTHPTLIEDFRQTARSETIKWIVVGVLGLIALGLSWLWGWFASGGLKSVLVGIPEGAIIAFDRGANDGACPDGWERFEPADGRAIIGAGGKSRPDISVYPPYKDDKEKGLGGHEIAPVNMSFILPIDPRKISSYNWETSTQWVDKPGAAPGGSTVAAISSIDVRQPYIALYMCKKRGVAG
jgi:hypothetical protein